jgi:hypothetical protein
MMVLVYVGDLGKKSIFPDILVPKQQHSKTLITPRIPKITAK